MGDMATLLNDSDMGIRRGAIFILRSGNPAPSVKALALLSAHLNDRNNSEEIAATIANAMLKAHPDSATVHTVLNLVEQRRDPNLRADVTHMLGLYRVVADESLAFIGDGLKNTDSHVRVESVAALEQMPREVQGRFTSELQRLADDPSENSDIRSRAQRMLKQN